LKQTVSELPRNGFRRCADGWMETINASVKLPFARFLKTARRELASPRIRLAQRLTTASSIPDDHARLSGGRLLSTPIPLDLVVSG
jgi:hypothetical protein